MSKLITVIPPSDNISRKELEKKIEAKIIEIKCRILMQFQSSLHVDTTDAAKIDGLRYALSLLKQES